MRILYWTGTSRDQVTQFREGSHDYQQQEAIRITGDERVLVLTRSFPVGARTMVGGLGSWGAGATERTRAQWRCHQL